MKMTAERSWFVSICLSFVSFWLRFDPKESNYSDFLVLLWTGCRKLWFCGITMIYLRAAWLLGMHTQGFIRVALKLRRLIFKRWDLCGFFRKCLRRPDAGKSSHCDNRARPKSTLSSWIYSEPRLKLHSFERQQSQCALHCAARSSIKGECEEDPEEKPSKQNKFAG